MNREQRRANLKKNTQTKFVRKDSQKGLVETMKDAVELSLSGGYDCVFASLINNSYSLQEIESLASWVLTQNVRIEALVMCQNGKIARIKYNPTPATFDTPRSRIDGETLTSFCRIS